MISMPDIDFDTHPHYREDNPCAADFGAAIRLLQWTPRDTARTEDTVLHEAREALSNYTFERARELCGLRTPFSLMKEMYCDILACNAAVIARILLRRQGAAEAADFLTGLYDRGRAAGFDRDHEFFLNRLDSRTFLALQPLINADYLQRIGLTRPDRALLCVGDCQTMQIAEWLRYLLPLPNTDVVACQHSLRTFDESVLSELVQPAAFVFFVNTGIQYGALQDSAGRRAHFLDDARFIVDWLRKHRPRRSVFVTHVFFGVDSAVNLGGIPRDRAADAVTAFADEVADILSDAPGARLVKLTDTCPLCLDTSPFRDRSTSPLAQHFRFPIMAAIAQRVARELAVVGLPAGDGGRQAPPR